MARSAGIIPRRPVFTDGNQPGPGLVPTVDTPYGRLATVIASTPTEPAGSSSRQGRHRHLAGAIKRLEGIRGSASRMAVFRASENGVVLASTRRGTRFASDHQGRLLGYKSDYFVGTDHTMIVNVPTSGAGTVCTHSRVLAGYASSACRCSWASRGCAGGNRGVRDEPD